MELKELFAQINSGKVAAHSELGTRDEAKQMRSYAARIRKMRTVTGIKAHALVMKDLVIPFNPFTTEADETYNRKTPFRPILLVSQAITGLKETITDPETQEKWNKILGTELEWGKPATLEEYYSFKKAGFIKPRIMSYSTVRTNFNGVGGFSEFPQRFMVNPAELNENGSYDPENAPSWHQLAVFFNMMLKPEVDKLVGELEKSGANKETIANQRQGVYAKSPIGFVAPTNLIPFLFFPLSEKPKEFSPERYMEIESCIQYYGYNADKWGVALKEIEEDNSFDENMDYYDFTIKTPSSTDTKGTSGQVYTDADSMDLYRALVITNTDSRFSMWTGNTQVDGKSYENAELYKSVFKTAEAYFLHSQEQSGIEGGETFEKLMGASNNFRPITSVINKLLPACHTVFLNQFANSPYFTEEVKKANYKIFAAMHPDNALALAASDEDELEDAAKAQQKSLTALLADAAENTSDELNFENVEVSE